MVNLKTIKLNSPTNFSINSTKPLSLASLFSCDHVKQCVEK